MTQLMYDQHIDMWPRRDEILWIGGGVALLMLIASTGCAPATMAQAQPREAPDKNYCPGRLEKARDRIRSAYKNREASEFGGESMKAGVTGPFGETVEVTIDTTIHDDPEREPEYDIQTGLSDLVFNCSEPNAPRNRCAFSVYLDGEKVLENTQFVRGQMEIRCVSAGRHELRLARRGQTLARKVVDLESDVEHLISVDGTGPDMNIEIYARNRLEGRVPSLSSIDSESSTSNVSDSRRRTDDPRMDRRRDRDHGDRDREYGDQSRHGDRYDDDRDHRDQRDRRDRRDRNNRDRDWDDDDHHGDDHHRDRRRGDDWDRDHDEGDDHRDHDDDWDDDRDHDHDRGHDHDRDRHDDNHHNAMRSGDFAELLAQVKEASFKDEKLGLVRTATRDNWFTADQAKRLVAQFDFKDSKVEAAVALHSRIVDKGNFFKVLSVFDFKSAKEEVRERTGYE